MPASAGAIAAAPASTRLRSSHLPGSTAPTRRAKLHAASAPTESRSRLALRLAVAFAAATGLFAVVVAHVVIDQKQFRIDAVNQAVSSAQAEETALKYQLAQLEAPQRIIADAVRLGMVMPRSVTYLTPAPLSEPVATGAGQPAAARPGAAPEISTPAPAAHLSSPTTSPSTSPQRPVGTRTAGR